MLEEEAELERVGARNIYEHVHCRDAARNEWDYGLWDSRTNFSYDEIGARVHGGAEQGEADAQKVVFVDFWCRL